MTLRRIPLALLGLYAALTLFSVACSGFGIRQPAFLTPLITLTGFSFALLHAGQREGWRRALLLLGLVFTVSLTFESVGVATGWIYGPYHYTLKLGPLFLGLVPYLIPVAWFMMMYPSFVIADRLIPPAWTGAKRVLALAAVGGLAMTAWDLVMDPIMAAGHNWIWDVAGPYFGIPLQNFAGWWLTVFVTFALYLVLSARLPHAAATGFDRPALLAYLTTALGIVLSSFVISLGNLALIGFFAMIPWVVAGWLKTSSA